MHHNPRETCYACYRPKSSCMCEYIQPIMTKTHFVILMHPKEFKKTKNGTGHFTKLTLPNSELHVGIDFSKNTTINEIINNPDNICYVLYPSPCSINLNKQDLPSNNKNIVIFLIDATWPCSRAMLKVSHNLNGLPKVSFTHNKNSKFIFKEQPKEYCLSTIESTLCLLELLNYHQVESLSQRKLNQFLKPFEKMVEYQLSCNL